MRTPWELFPSKYFKSFLETWEKSHFQSSLSAVKLGTDMLELDCHLTRDKKVVVLHDRSLLRVTGHDKCIKELDYDQLPLLKTSISIDFEPGKVIVLKILCHLLIFT